MPTTTPHTPTYTLDAGRCLVKDGQPLATLHGVGHYDPCELDQLIHTITTHLNTHAALVAALEGLYEHCAMMHKHWGEGSNAKEADAAIQAGQDALAQERGNNEEF